MTDNLTIALDGMGGAHAPAAVIEGAARAIRRYGNVRFIVYGDETLLRPLLEQEAALEGRCEIRHTDKTVGEADKPGQALRRGRESSMGLAIQAVRSGEAGAAVSGGNTGALMALSKFMLRTLPGIDRPALCSRFPTVDGYTVLLDLGANVEADENNLVQFAVMGAEFARAILNLTRPAVGLLNIGVEKLKGGGAIRAAGEKLKTLSAPMEFIGFVEGNDITGGVADVIVTDGFTGNVALKTAEGTAQMFVSYLGDAFRRSIWTRLGYLLTRRPLLSLRDRMDPRDYNGAVFIGLNGLVVKSHGSSDGRGFASAIATALDMAAVDLCGRIADDLKEFAKAENGDTAADRVGERQEAVL